MIYRASLSSVEIELQGLRHRNETANGALTMVSMSGGLQFFVDGAGFDDLPNINSVMFEPTQSDPNLFAGPALNSKYPESSRAWRMITIMFGCH